MSRPWLILSMAHSLTGQELAALLEKFGTAAELTASRPAQLRAAGLSDEIVRAITAPDEARLAAAEAWLAAAHDHHLIGWGDTRYPPLLRQIADPPVALFLRGDPATLALPQLAIVGSRNATAGGIQSASAFAGHLASRGLAITSGLALGIDAAAHAGAMDAGGRTIAVLGTGPEQIYPPQNAGLAERVAGHGGLCTEFLPGTPPLRENFPRRNRIISGLAVGTLVVEARLQSGALITARRATEQGREVFAIPGSIHNPLAKGCHRLIREGAKLVESGNDILEELAALLSVQDLPPAITDTDIATGRDQHEPDADYARLLEALGWDTVNVDTLVMRSGLTPAEVSSMLLILELQGSVLPLPGGRYQRQR